MVQSKPIELVEMIADNHGLPSRVPAPNGVIYVQPEWDSHVKKQQRALEALGVPTMGLVAEGDRARREKQGRVVGALEGMIGEG